MQITDTLHIMHCSKSLYTNITPFSQLYKRILQIQQMTQKPPRLPVRETGGAAVLWETPQALQSLSAAES